MSPDPAAAHKSAHISAQNKNPAATGSVTAGALRPSTVNTMMPGIRALAAPMRDIKADWTRWSRPVRISAVSIIAKMTIIYGLALAEAFAC